MRLVLLTSDTPSQRALAHRFATLDGVEFVGIVVQQIVSTRSRSWLRRNLRRQPLLVASKVAQRTVLAAPLGEILRAESVRFGDQPWPAVPLTIVTNINSETATTFVRSCRPDLVAVSGTRIVKQPMFDVDPPLGMLNLHTGISPFVKGGPNCTLWCLATGQPQLIGATVHELEPGIDTGAILLSDTLSIRGDESPGELVAGTMALGQDLYARTVSHLAAGGERRPVPQRELGDGPTYFTRDWNAAQLARAVRFVRSGGLQRWVDAGRPGHAEVRLVSLPAP